MSEPDPFEVMAVQLRDAVRDAARQVPFQVGMALRFAVPADVGAASATEPDE